jgi:hypothetical protein
VSRKASRGRQRVEDKERLRERVLVDGKGDKADSADTVLE